MRGRRYVEGEDKHFGRVRPVHLTELAAIEEQYVPLGNETVRVIRAHWPHRNDPPMIGSRISLHVPGQRVLLDVSRVSRPINSFYGRSVALVGLREVRLAMRRDDPCKCAGDRGWSSSDEWLDPAQAPATATARAERNIGGLLGLFGGRRGG